MRRAEIQHGVGHRQQRMQIERAALAAAHQRDRPALPVLDPLAELPGQDAATRDGEVAARRWLRRRQVEDVLLQHLEIQPPRRDAGAARRRGERVNGLSRAADGEMMIPPPRAGRRR